jgi:hypothetical protein
MEDGNIVTRTLKATGDSKKVPQLLTCDGIPYDFELGLIQEVHDTSYMNNFLFQSFQSEYPNLMQKIKDVEYRPALGHYVTKYPVNISRDAYEFSNNSF